MALKVIARAEYQFIHLYQGDNSVSLTREDLAKVQDYLSRWLTDDKVEGALIIDNLGTPDVTLAPTSKSTAVLIALYKSARNYISLSAKSIDAILNLAISPYTPEVRK